MPIDGDYDCPFCPAGYEFKGSTDVYSFKYCSKCALAKILEILEKLSERDDLF